MHTAARRFDNYALESAARTSPGAAQLLGRNRMKLWRRAYRCLIPEISRANRVLDFGCGSGDFLLFLQQVTQANLVGFDPSRTQIALARTRCRGQRRIELMTDASELSGSFDFVFSNHVIEHVPDDELDSYFRTMLDCLGPNGKLVVSAPNGLNPLAYAYYMSTDSTHLRMHSPMTLSELASRFGCEITGIRREIPQAYDLPSLAKTCTWWIAARLLKLGIYSVASGVRGMRFPLELAPTFFCVIERERDSLPEGT